MTIKYFNISTGSWYPNISPVSLSLLVLRMREPARQVLEDHHRRPKRKTTYPKLNYWVLKTYPNLSIYSFTNTTLILIENSQAGSWNICQQMWVFCKLFNRQYFDIFQGSRQFIIYFHGEVSHPDSDRQHPGCQKDPEKKVSQPNIQIIANIEISWPTL